MRWKNSERLVFVRRLSTNGKQFQPLSKMYWISCEEKRLFNVTKPFRPISCLFHLFILDFIFVANGTRHNQSTAICYGSDTTHLLFNLWYRNFNYTPAYENNLPQVDHIFPQSALKKVKIENPRTGRKDIMKYREPERNQLANCMLLSRDENGAGG